MPLDPITAFGLAANVVQFVHFGSNLLSESIDLYNSAIGATASNIELETVTKDIQESIAPLHASVQEFPTTSSYCQLLTSCDDVAQKLLAAVEKLGVKDGPRRKWRSFAKALLSVWGKEDISRLQERIGTLRDQIVLHITKEARDILE